MSSTSDKNPKSETRNPKEGRKSEIRKSVRQSPGHRFGFLIWDFFRISGFGFLVSFALFTQSARADSDEQATLRKDAATACRTVPATQPSTLSADGAQSLFFDGPVYHHKPTRVFAWYGFPAHIKPGEKVPAMVLIHGGGGTAFAEWVRLWNQKGYAAIAMDTCGCVPVGSDNHWQRDPQGGPPGWGGFDQLAELPSDQWTYHATIDVILANSLIRSWPQVDADRVGLTGISWGGYLTCIVAGLDDRFKFACPVYGCGYLGEDSGWLDDFKNLGPVASKVWLSAWDPSQYLPAAKMPILWVDGTNDIWYPPDSLRKSYQSPKGPRTLVMRVGMKHSHQDGWAPAEIAAFADSICLKQTPLPTIKSFASDRGVATATYESSIKIGRAELNFTLDAGIWKNRKWQTFPADLSGSERKARATLPTGATAYYINLTDERGLVASTELAIPTP
jgi:dienelactone hydrolase